ncbi:hypothetical protein MKX01_041532 [Papaver californicum]|nr:hypothetical protein MKX01_041532 [Papaver californicum]
MAMIGASPITGLSLVPSSSSSSSSNRVVMLRRTSVLNGGEKICLCMLHTTRSCCVCHTKQKAAQQASEDWYRRAQLALEKGDEDLAREALKRRKFYADNATSMKTQLDQQKNVVDNLISNTRLLESKIHEARSKKDTLKARAQSAKTATKMEEKVMMMESRAEALNQLITDDREGKFAYLESSSDDDLANLKKEISGRAVRKELPPGRSAVREKASKY